MNIKVIVILLFVLFYSCDKKVEQSDTDNKHSQFQYMEYNLMKNINYFGTKINNIKLMNYNDTLFIKEFMPDKKNVLLLHLPGTHCNDCNRKILFHIKEKTKKLNHIKLIVFGTSMNIREALIYYGKEIYIAKENLTNDINDFNYPYISITDSSLTQKLFFIPEIHYTQYLDSLLVKIERDFD
jgi:hypothetical protein